MSTSTLRGFGGLVFGLTRPVPRAWYVGVGLSLMAVKYALDAAAVYLATGQLLHPLRFLSPLWTQRVPDPPETFTAAIEVDAALVAMAVWALLFMWIGVSMSVRRAVDAGKSGWLGLWFMVPGANLVLIAVLSLLPSSEQADWTPPSRGPYRRGTAQPEIEARVSPTLRSALLGVVIGIGLGLTMTGVSVYVLGSYGASLFFLTPFMMGASGAYVFNRKAPQSVPATVGVASSSILVTGLAMVLLALEGVICILMAAPIALAIAILGAVLGRALAAQSHGASHATAALLMLPPIAGVEAAVSEPPVYEVRTAVEIDAPPEAVWPHVVGFSELPPPTWKLFDMGIAYPMRARIDGAGVGAVRHCEFSTGPFVEPITRWEPPSRLSFDVSAQPPAMHEWSPWADVYPPHLDASIRSQRGEFRLAALPGGRTRLEGSTWYSLEMAPAGYWRFWSDLMIHAIHQRVLDHVRNLSEAMPRGEGRRSSSSLP